MSPQYLRGASAEKLTHLLQFVSTRLNDPDWWTVKFPSTGDTREFYQRMVKEVKEELSSRHGKRCVGVLE